MTGSRRVSKASRRVYSPRKRLPRVLGGLRDRHRFDVAGNLTDLECRKRGIGGEVMCEVW